jgi:glycosyltransferase involved in cell wall biosynthesis
MHIAVFEYKIVRASPIGSCLLHMLQRLCDEHEFVVFAAEFDNPRPDRIHFVRIPTPTRPLAFLFLSYHLLAWCYYWTYHFFQHARFDLVIIVECNVSIGTMSYAHFCHRAYLTHHWLQGAPGGVRGTLRWLDHWLRAQIEPWVYKRIPSIVVPSRGLADEIVTEYPFTKGKIRCIPNPVDIERLCPPPNFQREDFRQCFGLHERDIVLVFVALGHFERKGLPLLLDALAQRPEPHVKLFVVGGEADLVDTYRSRARELGLEERIHFVGLQHDIRPFLWAADAFILPSAYETFSLVAFEAAAARLPLLVTSFHGVADFFRDGEHGFLLERSLAGVSHGIARFLAAPPHVRKEMGGRVQQAVGRYNVGMFASTWKEYYETVAKQAVRAPLRPS